MYQWPIITSEDKERVMECLDSGRLWRGDGKYIIECEAKLKQLHDVKYSLAVTNGTHALELALRAIGIRTGDEVLVPAFTFIASATAVLSCGAVPIPVDVDLNTFCMDVDKIEQSITKYTSAILPVHIAGHSCNMDPIMALAHKYKLAVIEDCAHAHGSEYKSKKLGSIGYIGTFSFQAIKLITAGEGGAIVTNSGTLYDRCYSTHNCGRVHNRPSYYHTSYASNYRISELQAALLVGQFDRFYPMAEEREKRVEILNTHMSTIPGITPQHRKKYATRQGYSMYQFLYDRPYFGNKSRERMIEILVKEGFPAFRAYPVFYKTDVFRKIRKEYPDFVNLVNMPNYETDFATPNSDNISAKGIWLPHYFLLSPKENLIRFINLIKRYATG
jgi:3-amino-5-hydroxybenzoate synthase